MVSGERRKQLRVPAKGGVRGKIHTAASVPVLDLSISGALLEVPCTLKVGEIYTLRLAIRSDVLAIKSKVVRSYVHGFDKNERGEMVIKYRAAIQFLDLSDQNQTLIGGYIRGVEKIDLSAKLHTDTDFLTEEK